MYSSFKKSVFLGTTECYSLVFFLNKKKIHKQYKPQYHIIWYYIPVYADGNRVIKLFWTLEDPTNGLVF